MSAYKYLLTILVIASFSLNAQAITQQRLVNSLNQAGGLSDVMAPPSGGTSELINVNAGAGNNMGCLNFNFGGQLDALMNTDITSIANNMAGNAISYYTMKQLCDYSPTLCQILQHMQSLSSAGVRFNQKSCQAVEKLAMQDGLLNNARKNDEVMKCVEGSGGNATDEILKGCMAQVSLYDVNGNKTNNYSPLKNMSGTLGWPADSPYSETLRAITGDVEYDVNGGITGGKKPGGISTLHETTTAMAKTQIKKNLERVANGKRPLCLPVPDKLSEAGMTTKLSQMEKDPAVAASCQGMKFMSFDQYQSLGRLDPIPLAVAIDKLAQAEGMSLMLTMYQKTLEKVNAAAISGASQGSSDGTKKANGADLKQIQEELKRTREMLEAYLLAYEVKNKIVDKTVRDVLAAAAARDAQLLEDAQRAKTPKPTF